MWKPHLYWLLPLSKFLKCQCNHLNWNFNSFRPFSRKPALLFLWEKSESQSDIPHFSFKKSLIGLLWKVEEIFNRFSELKPGRFQVLLSSVILPLLAGLLLGRHNVHSGQWWGWWTVQGEKIFCFLYKIILEISFFLLVLSFWHPRCGTEGLSGKITPSLSEYWQVRMMYHCFGWEWDCPIYWLDCTFEKSFFQAMLTELRSWTQKGTGGTL